MPAAVLAAPSWSSDFENGNLSAWSKVQSVAQDRITIVQDPVREGAKALKVTVRKGDDPINSGNPRAELLNLTHEPKGSEYYYRWSVMFPADYPSSPKWQLFTQWHQEGLGGTPPLEIYVAGEEINLRTGGNEGPVLWKAPLQRGQWQDFVLHVKWSDNPKEGFIEMFHNGKIALPKTFAATQLPGQLNYMKMGLYRSKEIQEEASLFFDDVRMGTSMDDVLAKEPLANSGGGWTSGTTSNPNDPNGPNSVLPTDGTGQTGCSSGGGSTLPMAAAIGMLGVLALVRRRRPAKVTVPVTKATRRR